MRIEIEIPKEFEEDFKHDRFEECLTRLNADAHMTAGNYEKETAIMLIKAFKNSKPAYDVDAVVERLEDLKSQVPVNRILDNITKDKPKELGQLIAYGKAIEIVKGGGKNEQRT